MSYKQMKAKTMQVGGNNYAKVTERIKEFRKDTVRGLIETYPTIEGDTLMFKARILKDKSDPDSAEATGHSYKSGFNEKKDFEKQESIAVGRALAMLGYAADGEIATGEEMQDFEEYQAERRALLLEDVTASLRKSKNLKELKIIWSNLDSELKAELEEVKNEIKNNYEN